VGHLVPSKLAGGCVSGVLTYYCLVFWVDIPVSISITPRGIGGVLLVCFEGTPVC